MIETKEQHKDDHKFCEGKRGVVVVSRQIFLFRRHRRRCSPEDKPVP